MKVQYECLILFLVFRKAFTKIIFCIRDLSDGQGIKLPNGTTGVTSKETLDSPHLPCLFFGIIFFLPIFPRPKASKFTFYLHSILKKKRREGVEEENNRDKRNRQL